MKAGKKLLALLLTVCMLLCMLPTVAFASGSDYLKIAMLDSGRKYFSADWVKAFLYEAKADGYTHVMLAVGNDGMRFLLDDMSLTVGGKTYSSNAVASAIRAGNNAYTTASSGEWTESEMDEFFATAKKAGIEIIPLLNSPGHMDSVLYAASSLTGTNCSYNGSSRTIDVTNDTAVRFSQAFLQKYVDYFAGKGCRYFNFGADEYANDRYTSGSMGFGSLQNSGKYGYFIKYVNELAAMVKQAGMTPIAFNDGIEFANKMSASVGSTTYTFDRDIVVCYWSGGWSGYTPRTAANLASDGFRIINTTGDFYYVLGKNDSFDNGYTYAANWSNYKVCGTSLSASSVIGGMFCMWSDYPGAETQTQEAKKIRLPLRAMGLAMDGAYTSGMDTSVVPGGFNADGSINTDPPAQSHDYRQTASTAATCTEAGSVTYTCADCGDSYTETVPALGHDYAAADDAGDTIYTCTRCGETKTETIPKLTHEHSYKAVVTAPTCTEKGYTTHTCACGDSYVDTYVDALGHAWDNGKVTKEPTETETGVKTFTCTRCGETKTETIPATGVMDVTKMFTDVSHSWADDGIQYCVTHQLMSGIGNNLFGPKLTTTRAQIVQILYNLEGEPKVSGTTPFTDLTQDWYQDAVLWAYQTGVVAGTSSTTFEPDRPVTREQIAVILMEYVTRVLKLERTWTPADLSAFPDADSVSDWAKDAMADAVGLGLISGASNGGQTLLEPQGSATREQVATILMEFCKNVKK